MSVFSEELPPSPAEEGECECSVRSALVAGRDLVAASVEIHAG